MKKKEVIAYLRMALLLKDPLLETDVAFKFTDDELWSIFQLVIPTHNPNYNVKFFPENEKYFAILLAKKEVYYRLAVASAPFYPLEAEGAKLRKDYRFEHYMSLIRRVEVEYAQMWGNFDSQNRTIDVGQFMLKSKHFTLENYQMASKPAVVMSVDNVGEDAVDISWSKFNISIGMFRSYTLYISKEPIYDEYEGRISDTAQRVLVTEDIHKTKFRFKDLTPDTEYYVAVASEDLNGLVGIAEQLCVQEVPNTDLTPSTPIEP